MTEVNDVPEVPAPLPEPRDGTNTTLSIMNGCGYVNMRCRASDAGAMGRIAAVLGQDIPFEPNTFSDGRQVVYWLGPDEWLIVTGATVKTLIAELRRETAGQHASFVDVSDGMVCMNLDGPSVRELLAKGCTLDLHERRFNPGQCAQTLLAKAPVLIACVHQDASFQVHVRRSFAEYAAQWLHHAGAEFGMDTQTA